MVKIQDRGRGEVEVFELGKMEWLFSPKVTSHAYIIRVHGSQVSLATNTSMRVWHWMG